MSYEGYQVPDLQSARSQASGADGSGSPSAVDGAGSPASAPGREAFTAPSLDDNSNTAIQFNSQQSQSNFPYGSNQNAFSGPESGIDDPPVTYLCGDCDLPVKLKRNDPIRCTECGYRVIYKERTKRMIQFEAR